MACPCITAAIFLGATLLCGFAPAVGLCGVEPNDALKEPSRGVVGERRLGVCDALVVAPVALSFVLVGAASDARSGEPSAVVLLVVGLFAGWLSTRGASHFEPATVLAGDRS